MKLYTNCPNCKSEITFSSSEPDRYALSKSKGEEIKLTCPNCNHNEFYHVNRIKAKNNRFGIILALMIFFVGTPLVIYFTWDLLFSTANVYIAYGLSGLIGIPFLIYSIVDKEQTNKVRLFNNYKLTER